MPRGDVFPNRDIMHRFMGPADSCDQCFGRGYYPVEDEPTDKYCDCPCGKERMRIERDNTDRGPSAAR